ncbi:MAG: hypothetical protein LQ342_003287 [Letrouitia transgressa]|nr:MAG: hypothetical protein LQ342_003287 [Letrouitia transgressa]
MSMTDKLDKIRSPKLQNQRETAVVLTAVEDTLRDQKCDNSPTAYFAALLALLSQSVSPSDGLVNKELAASVVYLLDIVTSYVPAPLLRSKFSQILSNLAPALSSQDVEAPLVRSSIGCLESLLIAQDTVAWALPQSQIGPRKAIFGLLTLSVHHKPKVRKRSQDAITNVLKNSPPSPSLDHPAADLCAETALRTLKEAMTMSNPKKRRGKDPRQEPHQPGIIHALQLVRTIASASGGWPAKKIESLCTILMEISKSSNEYLTIAAFDLFETLFIGMADEFSSAKLPRLLEAISTLRPSENDAQLLPPWIAVVSRGYDVFAQVAPEETFEKLPQLFEMITGFFASSSHNIRVSASECLISLMVNCIPNNVILEPSPSDKKVLEQLANFAIELLSVKYQAAWIEIFNVEATLFEALKWRSSPLANNIVKTIGELRGNDSFMGKKEADIVLGKAVEAMGPQAVLETLPLNLSKPNLSDPGRAWLLPVLRDHVRNTNLTHFRTEFVPLSEIMFQKVLDDSGPEKSMEIKIFETIVQQIWSLLPGYCNLPLDLVSAFDQSFAELLANLLYRQTELRPDICRALQSLVETNQKIQTEEATDQALLLTTRMTKGDAQNNLEHLASFAGNLLAVLFNVYNETLPQYRGYILQCINAFLSITPSQELLETFNRVTAKFESALTEAMPQNHSDKPRPNQPSSSHMPPATHTLMDLIITLSIYLPVSSYTSLFTITSRILPQTHDPQLQKKAYKLLPRLAKSPNAASALYDRNSDLQALLLSSSSSVSVPARRDRLAALAVVIEHLPSSDLHFIPSVLSEVVIAAKEVNEKARSAAFDLLVLMGQRMKAGGKIEQSRILHMASDAPVAEASLDEFFTMVSAGLVGNTPHMISASVTALTRILYEFKSELSNQLIEDLVSTMDLFLTSNSREIVRSCLGFMKVAVISLPEELMRPRLANLIPALIVWSREHKARFRSKVKHILERAMRRFGYEAVERCCPEEDRKFVHNIRKTKERRKRKKEAATATATATGGNVGAEEPRRKSRFESEYDEAVYGSDSSETGSDDAAEGEDGVDASEPRGRAKGRRAYIVEDPDEPLDLLDRKALGNISSSKPVKLNRAPGKQKVKTDVDGKLILGEEDGEGEDAMIVDGNGSISGSKKSNKETEREPGDGTLEGGTNAYVEAIRGRDAVQRGRGGRLKFSNKRDRGEKMDIDDDDGGGGEGNKSIKAGGKGAEKAAARPKQDPKKQRRGLGVEKVRGGRVVKSAGRMKGKGRK